jgi:O-Antigen ligase
VLGTLRLGGGGVIVRPSRVALVLLSFLAVLTGAAVGFSHGDPFISLLAPLSVIGLWLVWTRPLKRPLLILLFFALTLDDPAGRPYANIWRSPTYPFGRLFFANIALFTGFELSVYGLAIVMAIRRIVGRRHVIGTLDPVARQSPLPLQWSLVISAAVIGWLVVWGVLRGGDFREALWQFRALLMMPCLAMLMMFALDLPKDLPDLLRVLVVGSIIKALLGSYFVYAIASPQGIDPPHTTGHHDSMIFVTSVVTALAMVWERPSRRTMAFALLWLPFIFMAIRFNDRRIAYVEIAMAVAITYFLSPWHTMKRFVTRTAVMLLPVVAIYVVAGWNQRGGVFAPVHKIRTIVAPEAATEEESSNAERDTENYNIVTTWKENMFLGQGFGHAFHEYSPSNDFGQSNFGHVGHNSILWVMWIGGVVGFTGIFGYLIVALFLLGRTLHVARDWHDRVALLVSLSIVMTYLLQAFGDMGTQSALIDFCVACAMAIIGRTSTKWGVWAREPAELPTALPLAAI